MSETSGRLALPLIEAGQAQKEVTHNEALTLLDLLVQASVTAVGVDTPPASPAIGQGWVVGAAPTGAWAGHPGEVAGWTAGGWRFLPPREGMALWSEATGTVVRRRAGAWEQGLVRAAGLMVNGTTVVRAQRPAITEATGGTTVDARARTAVTQILETLRAHGLIAT